MVRETDARGGQSIEGRARVSAVSVAAEPLASQRVDHDEEDVQVFPFWESLDILDGSEGTRVLPGPADVDHRREEEEHDCRRGEQPGPALVDEVLRHDRGRLSQEPWFYPPVLPILEAMKPNSAPHVEIHRRSFGSLVLRGGVADTAVDFFRRVRAGILLTLILAAVGGAACDSADPLTTIRQQQTQGNHQETIEPLRALLRERPTDPELNYLYGRALVQTQQVSLASWPLRQAMEDPDWLLPAGTLLARTLLISGDFNEVVETTTRMLEQHPDDVTARLYRAQANAHWKKDAEAALVDAHQVLDQAPELLEAYEPLILALLALGRHEEASAELEEVGSRMEELGAAPDQLAWHCATTAIFAAEAGDLERARAGWEACLERFPADATVVGGAVPFFDARAESGRSTAILRRALEQEPGRRELRIGLAERLRRAGKVEEGEALLREPAVSGNRQVAVNALVDLAGFLHSDGRHAEAAEAFGQAVEIFRDRGQEPPVSLLFPYADALVVSGRLEDALEVAEEIEVPSQQRLIRARVAQERGDLEEAMEHFDEAIRLWPNNASARYYAARTAEGLGDFDRALEEYRYSVRASVGATDARTRAARLLIAEGRLLRAYQILFVEVGTAPLEPEGELLSMYLMGRVANPLQLQDALSRLALTRPVLLPEALVRGAEGMTESLGPQSALNLLTSVAPLDRTDPANSAVLRAIVRTAHAAGKPEQARRLLDAALGARPDAAVLHAIRGLELELGSAARDAVREAYERAVQLDPDQASALAGLGRLMATADPARALALFDRAIAIDSSQVEWKLAAVQALRALGRNDEVMQRLDTMLRDHPFEAAIATAWVEVDLERGQVSMETLGVARRAARFGGGPSAYERLARVQAELGDAEAAEQSHAQAQRLKEWRASAQVPSGPAVEVGSERSTP